MSDKRPTTTEIHERKHYAVLNSKTIERIVAEHVFNQVERVARDRRLDRPGVSFKVAFEDETEGSPGYKVRVRAKVTIIEDLLPQEAISDA